MIAGLPRPAFPPRTRARRRRDRLATTAIVAGLAGALAPLVTIVGVVAVRGARALTLTFLTRTSISLARPGGGWLHGLIGSLYMLGVASALVLPVGIATALYLVELRSEPLTGLVRFLTDVMTGVPSIFVGLFIYATLVATVGFGTLAGGAALALVMLPIVVRSGEEVLRLVPDELRQAAHALGARQWQVALGVVLPAAGPGLVTASMLAIARALGETAPLLLTAFGALGLVGAFTGRPQAALTLLIFDGARSPYAAGQAKAWAGALELMILVLLLNFLARVVVFFRVRR